MGGCFFYYYTYSEKKERLFSKKIHKIMAKRTLNLGCFKNNE